MKEHDWNNNWHHQEKDMKKDEAFVADQFWLLILNKKKGLGLDRIQRITKIHSSISFYDMYNPLKPNDYLTYRQNKENEFKRIDLEKQAKKTLEL